MLLPRLFFYLKCLTQGDKMQWCLSEVHVAGCRSVQRPGHCALLPDLPSRLPPICTLNDKSILDRRLR